MKAIKHPAEQPYGHSEPLSPPATPGTEQKSPAKVWLPRFIVAAFAINFIPALFTLFGEQHLEVGETVRNYANIGFIVAFLAIIIKIVTERT